MRQAPYLAGRPARSIGTGIAPARAQSRGRRHEPHDGDRSYALALGAPPALQRDRRASPRAPTSAASRYPRARRGSPEVRRRDVPPAPRHEPGVDPIGSQSAPLRSRASASRRRRSTSRLAAEAPRRRQGCEDASVCVTPDPRWTGPSRRVCGPHGARRRRPSCPDRPARRRRHAAAAGEDPGRAPPPLTRSRPAARGEQPFPDRLRARSGAQGRAPRPGRTPQILPPGRGVPPDARRNAAPSLAAESRSRSPFPGRAAATRGNPSHEQDLEHAVVHARKLNSPPATRASPRPSRGAATTVARVRCHARGDRPSRVSVPLGASWLGHPRIDRPRPAARDGLGAGPGRGGEFSFRAVTTACSRSCSCGGCRGVAAARPGNGERDRLHAAKAGGGAFGRGIGAGLLGCGRIAACALAGALVLRSASRPRRRSGKGCSARRRARRRERGGALRGVLLRRLRH